MSPEMAQQIFYSLFESLRENGFEDVGIYLLEGDNAENTKYHDSNDALQELYRQASNPQNALRSLEELLNVTRRYFKNASDLPRLFAEETRRFQVVSNDNVPALRLYQDDTNESIAVGEVLNNSSVESLLRLVTTTREYLRSNDDDFFNILNNSL